MSCPKTNTKKGTWAQRNTQTGNHQWMEMEVEMKLCATKISCAAPIVHRQSREAHRPSARWVFETHRSAPGIIIIIIIIKGALKKNLKIL